MINFPIFERIDVEGYGLYPGPSRGEDGLHVELRPGLTLIVGANGLGKTTLITILYRLLTGPFDIPSLAVREELGSLRLQASQVNTTTKLQFASRVVDRAANASATLRFRLGEREMVLSRRLSDLSLTVAHLDGEELGDGEAGYQAAILQNAGLGSFGDFVLMLRYLIFYFEDRRALVWDPSAQRQVLRMLFLPPDTAQEWTKMERDILERDSRMRNFQAVVGREEKTLSRNLVSSQGAAALRTELQALESRQEIERARLEALESETLNIDARRQQARLAHLKAEQERETQFRSLEHAKLAAIDARFPGRAETGKYVLAHLMSEAECLVCGSVAPDAAEFYAARLANHHCVVCASDLSTAEKVVGAAEVADQRMAKARHALNTADEMLNATSAEKLESEGEFAKHIAQLAELESGVADRSVRIDSIVSSLPPSEVAIRQQRDELAGIKSRLETMKAELADARTLFREFIEQKSEELVQSSQKIQDAFARHAQGFLSERVSLSWSSRRAQIGQGGEAISFPSFDLDMSGSDFGDQVRRRAGPEDVSESQREFIDLAFRMALMSTAGHGDVGSLVIDAPESSLDAVFARRAANILTRFATPDSGNRLVITSNLVEGSLIPTLIAAVQETPDREDRIVDLFEIARPTAAIERDRQAYDEIRHRMLGGS